MQRSVYIHVVKCINLILGCNDIPGKCNFVHLTYCILSGKFIRKKNFTNLLPALTGESLFFCPPDMANIDENLFHQMFVKQKWLGLVKFLSSENFHAYYSSAYNSKNNNYSVMIIPFYCRDYHQLGVQTKESYCGLVLLDNQ